MNRYLVLVPVMPWRFGDNSVATPFQSCPKVILVNNVNNSLLQLPYKMVLNDYKTAIENNNQSVFRLPLSERLPDAKPFLRKWRR